MPDDSQTLPGRLRELRVAAGRSASDVERELVFGPGWLERIEAGEIEPTLGLLSQILGVYGVGLGSFFSSFDAGADSLTRARHLAATAAGDDVLLHFPLGPNAASVRIPGANLAEFEAITLALRDSLAAGHRAEAVVEAFLLATATWPHINPSDLWYFLISHAYQDSLNHPAHDAGRDWAQSWKRASGWALETIFVRHYNPALVVHGLRMEMPDSVRKDQLLRELGIQDASGAEKSDILLVGDDDGTERAFGVVHVKASFAERRTDDVPLSKKLIALGYASPLLTMDCKAGISAAPFNRGELGATRGTIDARISSKRLDIEVDKNFDACFSYNTNTLPTPVGQSAAARISVLTFANANDDFADYVLGKWHSRFEQR